ncbi:acyltransferase [Hyphobacterium sp. HN65]|uniref:Acyltransferase n=1 Tax=Hyphobacterium lacteum TaxID=3116575 RepID=A0ABU7LTV3_9PROT|nr:acyltransferase [Hyphobacterium sp. HN65]MEE2527332.1 acyltransferase [Hyphobacterium sp. HN65]
MIPVLPGRTGGPALADIYKGHDNLFTLIRLLLAGAVLLEHAFIHRLPVSASAPLEWHDISLSYGGVNAFFILSGFLISDSLRRRRSYEAYAAARILRIYPALIALVFAAIFIVGPFFTALTPTDYWFSPEMWRFPFETLTFVNGEGGPPGTFPSSERPGEFSASLWTLRYEVIAYIGLPIFAAIPLVSGRWGQLILFLTLSALYEILLATGGQTVWSATFVSLVRLGACFSLGMTIFTFREHLKVVWLIPALLTFLWLFLTGETIAGEFTANLMIAGWMFTLAFASGWAIKRLKTMPDYSYGLYIWHWPAMQIGGELFPEAGAFGILAFSIPVTMLFSMFSWHLIERPALGSKKRLAALIERVVGRHKQQGN